MRSTKVIVELKDRLKLEHAQTSSEYAVVLCAMSASSVFLLNGMSTQIGNAVITVARLLP
jgi:hypothetical protein